MKQLKPKTNLIIGMSVRLALSTTKSILDAKEKTSFPTINSKIRKVASKQGMMIIKLQVK